MHMFGLPGPLINLTSRFQAYYAARRYANKKIDISPKKGVLILVGGGDGKPDYAIRMAKMILRNLGANYDEDYTVLSLNTDLVPAFEDTEALQKIKEISLKLSK